VLRGVHNPADKLDLLISSCTGEAREHRRILETNYGQSHIVVDAYVRTLIEGPSLRANDPDSLAKLARDMKNCLITGRGFVGAGLDTQHTVGSIFRLPKDLQDKFLSEVSV